MAKKSTVALWIVGASVGAIAAYELFFKSKVPSGYQPVTVAPGLSMQVHAPTGNVAFVLPSGGKWLSAGRQDGTTETAIPLPASSAPMLLVGVGTGTRVLIEFSDAVGNGQAAGYAFV